ncbi:MAG: hypothetical protein IPK50_19730 [Fibrobacterota bacterium]|nr:hypothetical protein [Fibrobacterota bacterium]QQS04495.1 MAG: hypothetical protein IPK50_19730 [Fibrobacterota bacterium]
MRSRSIALARTLSLLASFAWSQTTPSHTGSGEISVPAKDSTANHAAMPAVTTSIGVHTDPHQDSLRSEMDKIRAQNPSTAGADTAIERNRSGGHFRAGLHASSKDIGILIGGSVRARSVSLGMDGWIRPGTFTQEVRITPTRRAQYKEVIYGFHPWIQLEIGSQTRLAVAASLDVGAGMWYGTSQSPKTDVQPALGLKILFPALVQIGIRRAWNDGLLGHWRGEVACEF